MRRKKKKWLVCLSFQGYAELKIEAKTKTSVRKKANYILRSDPTYMDMRIDTITEAK